MSILQTPFPTPILQGGYDVPIEARRLGALASDTDETPLDVTAPVVIDTIIIGSTVPDLTIRVAPRNQAGTPVDRGAVGASVGSTFTPNLTLIRDGRSPLFDVQFWDEIQGRYVVALRAPLYWPRGGRITLRTPVAATSVTAHISYRRTGATA